VRKDGASGHATVTVSWVVETSICMSRDLLAKATTLLLGVCLFGFTPLQMFGCNKKKVCSYCLIIPLFLYLLILLS